MSNVHTLREEPKIDVLICYCTSPPCIIPQSRRAVELLQLPDWADAILYPYNEAEEVLALFPDDYLVADGGKPINIIVKTIV